MSIRATDKTSVSTRTSQTSNCFTLLKNFSRFVLFGITSIINSQNVGLFSDTNAEIELWRSFVRSRIEFGYKTINSDSRISEWARNESWARALEREYHKSTIGAFSLDETLSSAGIYYKDSVLIKIEFPIFDISSFRDKLLTESDKYKQRLWQTMNAGGIGVTRCEKRSYVTLVLLESIRPLPLEQVRQQTMKKIDLERRAAKLKAISWKKRIRETAQLASENAMLGKSIDYKSPSGMMAELIKLETPDLIFPENFRYEYKKVNIRQAGLGIVFGRNRQYPGGRYLISILFLSKIE